MLHNFPVDLKTVKVAGLIARPRVAPLALRERPSSSHLPWHIPSPPSTRAHPCCQLEQTSPLLDLSPTLLSSSSWTGMRSSRLISHLLPVNRPAARSPVWLRWLRGEAPEGPRPFGVSRRPHSQQVPSSPRGKEAT